MMLFMARKLTISPQLHTKRHRFLILRWCTCCRLLPDKDGFRRWHSSSLETSFTNLLAWKMLAHSQLPRSIWLFCQVRKREKVWKILPHNWMGRRSSSLCWSCTRTASGNAGHEHKFRRSAKENNMKEAADKWHIPHRVIPWMVKDCHLERSTTRLSEVLCTGEAAAALVQGVHTRWAAYWGLKFFLQWIEGFEKCDWAKTSIAKCKYLHYHLFFAPGMGRCHRSRRGRRRQRRWKARSSKIGNNLMKITSRW